MGKSVIILLFALICVRDPSLWADEGKSGGCPRPMEPMTEALHAVVSQAEEQAGKGDAKGAADLLIAYLEAHPKETHSVPIL